MEAPLLTCTACTITLDSQDKCRDHYKSDFHTYNLKRKLVSLPPVTIEVFEAKKAEARVAQVPSYQSKCSTCNKTFSSEKVYEDHMTSKKHRTVLQKQQTRPERTETEEGSPLTTCVFCNAVAAELESNLRHMLSAHSFFIPDIEHVENLEAMMGYINEKVMVGYMCLYCNNEGTHSFKSAQAVQQHMLDKQHCFLNTEDDEEEYAHFYEQKEDYRMMSLVSRTEELPAEVMETGELRLRSGLVLGHKKYARYYKQRLHERPERETRLLAIMAEEYQKLEVTATWRGIEKIQKHEQMLFNKEYLRQAERANMLKPFHRAQNPK
mmetsp:Transcript_14903/g.27538  ORF Transcript_14903/g.27538 Transcript_14903/m.27538 type:complete len:323 (-) Transcript_14903:43-1011(-)|eukprot:CAMPEP_0204905552 /NCGR_PEP_ID=MMETSP1397-20131031/5480_1 /ASSEMBLY_ACC=CAM_ASM_000891 /TAXON_ID=49980 /ORGANISM="Climacostomum Climacostomum virens, Strain Stock W-24" /LENGTH=322 /DNA_ID=CAMNT_0052074439 /DNA_START=1 /DNA_END=972 /DNA_ORIENTATION=+